MHRRDNGITLAILAITVIVILILTGTIMVSTSKYLETKKYVNVKSDIKILQSELPIYYEQNSKLPVGGIVPASSTEKFGSDKNPNDNSEYYIIDLDLLPGLTLNYGYGKESDEDYYVVNTGSFSVYYLKGVSDGKTTHYTIENFDSDLNAIVANPLNEFILSATATTNTITVSGGTTSTNSIKGYKFRIDNTEWTNLQSNGQYTFPNLEPGKKYKVSMMAVDTDDNIIMASNNNLAISTAEEQMTNGMFSIEKGVNTPDTSKLPVATTKYVTWTGTGTYQEQLLSTPPSDWYDYSNSKWANIKTTNVDGSLQAYWVWIPRFAYKLSESSTAKTIDITFIKDKSTTGVNGEKCYYSTDPIITNNGTGLYVDSTTLAKGNSGEKTWIVHPAFSFGNSADSSQNTQLSGIWVAKYEASSSNPGANYGGGDTTTLKVQVKPNVTSWRYINEANSFANCRSIQNDGGALGTTTGTTTVDTHIIKNIEWGAVALLSQSKYGNYDRATNTNIQVWNNPNNSYITGNAGSTANQGNTTSGSCYAYNTVNGVKASTTGNVYGIYDMAGGAWEQVAGVLTGYTNILGNPEAKYYDLYTNPGNINTNYEGGKIGDITREFSPGSNTTWNGDRAYFMDSAHPLLCRGGYSIDTTAAGIFEFGNGTGGQHEVYSFRPTLIII